MTTEGEGRVRDGSCDLHLSNWNGVGVVLEGEAGGSLCRRVGSSLPEEHSRKRCPRG